MSASKTTKTPAKYSREKLIHSKKFSGYQKDFVSVLLDKPEYTMAEAEEILSKALGPIPKGGK